jgi:hypothetical protein
MGLAALGASSFWSIPGGIKNVPLRKLTWTPEATWCHSFYPNEYFKSSLRTNVSQKQ